MPAQLRAYWEAPATPCYAVTAMEIRPLQPADLNDLAEIDGTVESSEYLHLERVAEGLTVTWKLTERTLREPRVERNRLTDDAAFVAKQLAADADEGLA